MNFTADAGSLCLDQSINEHRGKQLLTWKQMNGKLQSVTD